MKTDLKHIIFDMDGTLINSGIMIAKTINFVRTNIGLEPLDHSIILEKINDPDINSAEFFYQTNEFTQEQTELFNQYYHKNCIVGVELYDGVEDILKDISKKYTLSIATNANSIFAHKILKHLNVYQYFDYIIGHDMVKNSKPDPEMILKILNKFDLNKNETILIGDSHKDLYAAKNAQIDCILVNWGFSDHNNDKQNNIIHNTQQLKQKLDEY
jgi:phosphoglycolate phosphatase